MTAYNFCFFFTSLENSITLAPKRRHFVLNCLQPIFLSIFDNKLEKIISLLLFTVPYQVIHHWKGQKLNFQKKNISDSGNP